MAGVKKSRLEVLIGIIILCEIVLQTTAISPCLQPGNNCKFIGVECHPKLKICQCSNNRSLTTIGICSNRISAQSSTIACDSHNTCHDACNDSQCAFEIENSSKGSEKVNENRVGLTFFQLVIIIAIIAVMVTITVNAALLASYRFYFSKNLNCKRFVEGGPAMELSTRNAEGVASLFEDILSREEMTTVREAIIASNVTSVISFLRVSQITDLSSSIIINTKKISSGHFSNVLIGELHSESGNTSKKDRTSTVVLKEIKREYDSDSVKCAIREVECMRMVNHTNLLSLTGFYSRGISKLPWIILDFVIHGSLLEGLLDNNVLWSPKRDPPHVITEDDFPNICSQIACGMQHLHENRIIHGDLAARNVLIGDNNTVKIADFGLSRNLHSKGYYPTTPRTRFAFPWMAYEVLVFNQLLLQSDVWSFGVLLWEMSTFGSIPFNFIDQNVVVENMKKRTDEQELLAIGQDCPEMMRDMMMRCWRNNPEERVRFPEIKTFFLSHMAGGSGV
ncbi:fibroblast growth factor receptor 1-like [Planococcus citri]|uniref:fibroblast growth factor receptor 1-like n=1 Tax=Planococcus citri TaxID=170843 RepID=UPI0031F7B2D5